jgi:hypothetical protein
MSRARILCESPIYGGGLYMKRITIIITTAVFSVLLTVMTVYADEAAADGTSDQQTQLKNECLLKAKNCGHSAIWLRNDLSG